MGLWFFSGFLGAFLGSCLKLRGSIVFSCKANVSQCGSDLHRYYVQKKIRIRAPATRHWLRSMRDPNPFACHPPPRAALDCRILARGDCGPAKLAVGSLINCHWCAVGVLGLPLLGRRAAGFPGAGSRVSFAAARSATTSAGNRFIVRDACVFKMHSC